MNWEKYGIDITKVRGGKTICPKCSHTRKHKNDPCLSVDIEKGLFNCHHCDFKGGVKNIKMAKEYVKPLPRLEKLTPEMIKYFEDRGISNNTLLRAGLTYTCEYMPQQNKEMNCICFNYYRDSELINIKYRTGAKDFKLSKDAELIFYNIDSIKGEKEAYIVEGEIDCLSLMECGIMNVVSVPNGASRGSQRLEYLDNCWEYFEDIDKVYLLTDNDEPGLSLRDELARRIGIAKCFKFQYPDDCKDANDVLVNHGKEALTQLCKSGIEFPIDGVFRLDDLYDDVVRYYEEGYPDADYMPVTGFNDENGRTYLKLMGGQMTIVTGSPGSGKSEFIDWVMSQTAIKYGWGWAVCSFENQPSSLHVTKIMEKIAGKAFGFRKNPFSRMNTAEFEQAVLVVDNHFHFININQADVTLSGILEKSKELVKRYGIKGILIDPWNYIEHKIPKGYTETQYISEALTEVKTFAMKYGVHVIMIAHPTKLRKDPSTGKYEIPTMYSISGSAHFFNKTDNGISIVRDFDSGVVDVYLQKVRYSWLGKVGFTSYNFDVETRQYINL